MKLIKKIAAIMFAFMMVVSMSCNVKADDTTTATEKGTITINNAVDGQTYTIYKLLDLESYEPKKNEQGEEIGNYSYKPNKDWNDFISTAVDSAGTKYFIVDENGYARWNVDKTKTAEFAQKALVYAKDKTHPITGTSKNKEKGVALTFENLSLGYYLVDSSVGALCSLDTTNPTVTIEEKNSVPTVTKKIIEDTRLVETNTVNYGDIVNFRIDISIGKGAKNYLLHDKMDQGLTLNTSTLPNISPINFHDQSNNNPRYNTDFTVNTTPDDGCTFHVEFKDSYLNTLTESVVLTGNYAATVNKNAKINEAINNTTWLSYGDNQNTIDSKTKTYTFGIPVFKYTGTEKTALAGAKFRLYTDEQCKDENVVKVKTNGTDYIVGDTDTNNNVMTSGTTVFNINGLKAGTYYLKEIEAPKGYNKLANAIKVEITNDGKVRVEKNGALTDVTQVDVENKTGTVLPSTGGAGTTMIYLVGAVLVLGSGVVLVTKRRVKGK